MPGLYLDFETYYDKEYSLRKMTPAEYILDPRFETIGMAAKLDNGPSEYIDAPDIPTYLAKLDPRKTTTIAFNALFDNSILAWRYNFVPALMICTMRLAVATRGHMLERHSLRTVGEMLGLRVKKGTAIELAGGMHREDIVGSPNLYPAYRDYANTDNDMNAAIWKALQFELPAHEYKTMDRVLRCTVQPQFRVDLDMLRDHRAKLAQDREALVAQSRVTPEELRSTAKFAALLRQRGVVVEYKEGINAPIPALAKTDQFMQALLSHEDPTVRALAAARLGVKSTIEETRAEKFIRVAGADWSHYRCGNATPVPGEKFPCYMPVPLKYAGAHTHRLSGDWSMNMQNLPTERGGRVTMLRRSLICASGYDIVVADLAQIECRLNAWFCGQHDLLELFRTGTDPYSKLASEVFGGPVDKNTEGGVLRFIGKAGELGLGYRCGPKRFYDMVLGQGRSLGLDMEALTKVWTPELAERTVYTYRNLRSNIANMWRMLDSFITNEWLGDSEARRLGPVTIGKGYIEGPGGLKMHYGNPRWEGEYFYNYGHVLHKMHGGVMLENIIQFLARIVLMDAAQRVEKRTKIRFAFQAHDELAWIVPSEATAVFKNIVESEMAKAPTWAPNIPLMAEVNSGKSYGEAK